MPNWNNPAVTDFQTQFFRDFPYGVDVNNNVLDQDILNAFTEVNNQINQNNFLSQSSYTSAYLYLAAHILVTNLQNSSQGINGQYNWLQASKGVGGVSESFSIPEQITRNPVFAALTKTTYGCKYLMMILPNIAGPTLSVRGFTKP